MPKDTPRLRWPPEGSLLSPTAALLAPGIIAGIACALLGTAGWLGMTALEQSGRTATPTQSRIALVTTAALCALASLGAWRLALARLRTLTALSGAIRAAAAGAAAADEVTLHPAESADAIAWNTLAMRLLEAPTIATAKATPGQPAAHAVDSTDAACDALWLGMLVIDAEGQITYANGASAVLLGKRPGSLTLTPAADALDPETAQHLADALAGRGPKRTTLTVQRQLAPGTIATLRVSLRLFDAPTGRCAVITLEDATKQIAADRAKTAFVEQAAHELRTPLTNIQLYIEELIDLPDSEVTARTSAINVISREATRLERIVADMLSVAEIEAGAMSLGLGDVRLEPLMDDLRNEYQAQALEKGLTLTFDLPPKFPLMRADRDKLVLILHNVLGNALKYTPAGGTVTLNMHEDAGHIVFDITDTGIGIPPAEADKVFERFYRVKDERTAEVVGTGLGLPLAREFARMHGGDIAVQSTPNVGSTFTITIPSRSAPMAAAA